MTYRMRTTRHGKTPFAMGSDQEEPDETLRVLHVTASNQRRGAEVFAADLIGALQEGIEHEVAYLRGSSGAAVTFPCATHPLPGGGGPTALFAQVRALRSLVAQCRPDVVQVHGGEALRLAVLAGLGRRRSPVVYRRIGMAPPAMRNGWRRRWHRWLMGRAAIVICVAEAVRVEALQSFAIDLARAVTIPNAVAPDRLAVDDEVAASAAVRAELGVALDARLVLSLGALSWEKDPLGALDVTAEMLGLEERMAHVFVGDGPLRSALQARISELRLSGRVVLAGGRNDVGRLLAAADVVLFASRSDGMEGMPATVIEGGLAGRPVVAVGVAGVAEVVENGVTGVVVEPSDRQGLRAAVRELLENPGRGQLLGAAAAARCKEHFTIEVVAPRYREIWVKAIRLG